jgi:hypothetical protein
VPKFVKRTLTSMQITQFLVGVAFAACHLFVSYTVPVSVAHQITEKVARAVNTSSVSSAVASATSSAAEVLPVATGAAVAFLRKLIYRAAGDEGLAENIAVPGHPVPHYQQQLLKQQLADGHRPEHPVEHFFHHPHETVNRVIYRTEYQSVPCIDTSGQAFAVYLNIFYLSPLIFLFGRFFFKSYLRSAPPNRPQTKRISDATRDASEDVKREVDHLERAAEDGVSSAVNSTRDALRGRKANANGVAKEDRHGSLSPANKKFVDSVKRKASQRLQELGESADDLRNKAKNTANDLAGKAGEAMGKAQEQSNTAKKTLEDKSKQAKDNVEKEAGEAKATAEEKSKQAKGRAEDESKPYIDAVKDGAQDARDKAQDTKDSVKKEANNAQRSPKKSNGKAQDKQQPQNDDQSQDWETAGKKSNSNANSNNNNNNNNNNNKSKLPQKKKERKETEESGVLVKKEDAEEPADEEVQKPEKEPEPKDLNNTLDDAAGKGLF